MYIRAGNGTIVGVSFRSASRNAEFQVNLLTGDEHVRDERGGASWPPKPSLAGENASCISTTAGPSGSTRRPTRGDAKSR